MKGKKRLKKGKFVYANGDDTFNMVKQPFLQPKYIAKAADRWREQGYDFRFFN